MKILIVDDNKEFIKKLKKDLFVYFSEFHEEVIFYTYSSPDFFADFEIQPTYAFIDIDLPDKNGIDLAQQIALKFPKTLLTFISSHSHLVHQTLIVRPLYFVRKNFYKQDLEIFYSLIKDAVSQNVIIEMSYNREKARVFVEDIIYIEAEIHKLLVHTQDRTYLDNRSLKEMRNKLSSDYFIQIHRSFIININYLTKYKGIEVFLDRNICLTIGRKYKENFEKFYREFLLK